MCAAVGGLHNARSAAGTDNKSPPQLRSSGSLRNLGCPFGKQTCKLPRLMIKPPKRSPLADASGAEENDGVLNLFFLEMGERPKIFGEYAQRARLRTLQKGLFPVRDGAAAIYRFGVLGGDLVFW